MLFACEAGRRRPLVNSHRRPNHSHAEIAMGYPDPNAESSSLQLVEATHLRASADASLNTIKVEIIDPVGSGIAFLISPSRWLI
jgi:hypothetical protein